MQARQISLHHQTQTKLQRLKKEADQDGAYRVATRIQAVLLNAGGKTSGEIAMALGSHRSCVSDWLKNYALHGYEGLLEGQRSGRPKELSDVQLEELSDILDSGPVAYGFLSGVWTSIMITQIIEDEFLVAYHPAHVRKMLDQIGFSVQRPRKLLMKADPLLQSKWRRYTYPNIKKKPVKAVQK